MIKKLLLVILAFTTGVALYFIIVKRIPPMTLINSVTSRIPSLPTLIATVKNNLSLIGTGFAGLTGISYLVKKVGEWKAKTTEATEQAETWKNEAYNQNTTILNLQKKNTDLEKKLETLKIPEDKTDLLNQITTKDKEITQLNERALEAERLVNVVMHPTTKDMITRLEKEGYTIRKTVT